MEIWKDIPGYKNYQVSSIGRVKKITKHGERFSRLSKTLRGYLCVGLHNENGTKTFGVHRLIALAFIPNPDNKPEVNHIDNNKGNNHINNLEWITKSDNVSHQWRFKETRKSTQRIVESSLMRAASSSTIIGWDAIELSALRNITDSQILEETKKQSA